MSLAHLQFSFGATEAALNEMSWKRKSAQGGGRGEGGGSLQIEWLAPVICCPRPAFLCFIPSHRNWSGPRARTDSIIDKKSARGVRLARGSFDAVSRICIMHARPDKFRYPRRRIRKRRHLLFICSLSANLAEWNRGGDFRRPLNISRSLPRGTKIAARWRARSHNGETVSRCASITWKAHYPVRFCREPSVPRRASIGKLKIGTFCPGGGHARAFRRAETNPAL